MALDQWDAFKELQFEGKPSGYRDFMRKVLLGVAGLEEKHAHLAGPRLLAKAFRRSMETDRTPEHQRAEEARWMGNG